MNILNTIKVNPTGLSKILSSGLYANIVRLRIVYGLVIDIFTSLQLKRLADTQNKRIRKIYGTHDRSSTKVGCFIWRNYLPWQKELTFCKLSFFIVPYICRKILFLAISYLMSNTPVDINCTISQGQIYNNTCSILSKIYPLVLFEATKCTYLLQHLLRRMQDCGYKPLSLCRPQIVIDPIL